MATHRRFDEEFKRDALKRAAEPGTNKSALAKSLEISGTLLHRWIRESQAAADGTKPARKKPGRPRKDASASGAQSNQGADAQAQSQDQNAGQGENQTQPQQAGAQERKKPGRPRKATADVAGAQGGQANQGAQAAAPQERKKPGRPRKNAAEGTQAQGATPQTKRPGRPRRQGTETQQGASTGNTRGGVDLAKQLEAVNAERVQLKKALSYYMKGSA